MNQRRNVLVCCRQKHIRCQFFSINFRDRIPIVKRVFCVCSFGYISWYVIETGNNFRAIEREKKERKKTQIFLTGMIQ